MTYQYYELNGEQSDNILRHNDDGTTSCIPNDPLNRDWQDYQTWLGLGNTPEAA